MYDTPIPDDKLIFYNKWLQETGRGRDQADYDTQGAFLAGVGGDGHWPDTFKKPNHPTLIIRQLLGM